MHEPVAHLEGSASPQSTVDDAWWAWSDSAIRSRLHRLGVSTIYRLAPESRRDALIERLRLVLHRGDRVECAICGSRFRHFMARWNSENVTCWRCGSQERHRTLWLFLSRMRPELLDKTESMLHFAPEPGLEAHLRPRVSGYVSCDLDPELGDLTLDITALDLQDAGFDATICSHVLEHIPDDARAMSELHRILKPGGWALVMVPVDHSLPATLEDPSITSPAERRRVFWQEDHVRLYGLDVMERLERAGFEVEHLRPSEELDAATVERHRLGLGNDVFLCRKPA